MIYFSQPNQRLEFVTSSLYRCATIWATTTQCFLALHKSDSLRNTWTQVSFLHKGIHPSYLPTCGGLFVASQNVRLSCKKDFVLVFFLRVSLEKKSNISSPACPTVFRFTSCVQVSLKFTPTSTSFVQELPRESLCMDSAHMINGRSTGYSGPVSKKVLE